MMWRYTINTKNIRLPKCYKVIYNPKAGGIYCRWDWIRPYGKIPIFANRDFIRMYRDRLLCSKEQKKELRMPKGIEQNELF